MCCASLGFNHFHADQSEHVCGPALAVVRQTLLHVQRPIVVSYILCSTLPVKFVFFAVVLWQLVAAGGRPLKQRELFYGSLLPPLWLVCRCKLIARVFLFTTLKATDKSVASVAQSLARGAQSFGADSIVPYSCGAGTVVC